ncbi:hypothetical protein D9M70_504100 [compost metagenome]
MQRALATEVAVVSHGDQGRTFDQQLEGAVEVRIVETPFRIAEHHGIRLRLIEQPGELLFQPRVDQAIRPQTLHPHMAQHGLRRTEYLLGLHGEAHAGQFSVDGCLALARGVGDQAQGQALVLQQAHRLQRARQGLVVLVEHSTDIEQHRPQHGRLLRSANRTLSTLGPARPHARLRYRILRSRLSGIRCGCGRLAWRGRGPCRCATGWPRRSDRRRGWRRCRR